MRVEGACSSVAKIKPKAKKKVTAKKKAPAKLNPLDDPAALEAPLTPRSLGTQTQAATNLAYGGAEQDLAGQQRQADVTATSIPAWFKDYRDAQAHAEQSTQQAYAGAVGAQQNATNSTYGLDTQNAQQVGAAQAATAASAGGVADPSLQQKAQQAALSRRSAGDAATTLTAGLGAAQTAYRAGQSTVGAAQQLKAQLDQEGRKRDIAAKGTQLAKDKGNYAVTTRQKLIDSNHTKQLEDKAFGLNVIKEQDDAAAKAAATATSAANNANSNATSAANTRARNAQSAANNAATLASREREGHLTRLTRKKTAATIAAAGNISPAERRRRNDAVNAADDARVSAIQTAQRYLKIDPKSFADPEVLRHAIETKNPKASKEAVDYALAAALGKKAGVTKKGQLNAAQRYRKYLKELADGTRSK
jgi:hypothetical protein